jgi:2-isopropylmalate synthase
MDSESEINNAFAKFKDLADRKSEIFDEDILALVSEETWRKVTTAIWFRILSQHSETGEMPQATVVMTMDGKEVTGSPTAMARWMPR